MPTCTKDFYEDYSKPDIETREATIKYNHVYNGDLFYIGSVTIKAIHTPGHTAGSISFLIENDNSDNETTANLDIHNLLFTGDTLFVTGIGRPESS